MLEVSKHELCLNTVLRVGAVCCLTLPQFKLSLYSCSEDGVIQQQCLLSACHAANYAEWLEKHMLSLASKSETWLGRVEWLAEITQCESLDCLGL